MPDEARILVTGGAGFIGSHFVRRALGAGWAVVNLDALTYAGNPASLRDVEDDAGYCFHHGNICDAELVARLLAEHQPCALINFAAESHVDRSIERPGDFIETNVVGTQRLLQCAVSYWEGLPEARRAAFRYIQVSTDEVYGSIEEGQACEETRYAPNSPYAASKAAGDHLVRAFHRTYGLPALATCCTNNYGPNQFPEKLIPLTILKARAGESIPIYGDGLNRRDWIHVFDHCEALLSLLDAGRPGESYNIGADNELANLDHSVGADQPRPSSRCCCFSWATTATSPASCCPIPSPAGCAPGRRRCCWSSPAPSSSGSGWPGGCCRAASAAWRRGSPRTARVCSRSCWPPRS
jgi:dTDP-glucose 4,6-dehydratase